MDNQLGARIAKLRRACGMTQETLGNRLGVSAAAVSKWETGAACPDVTLLCPLARALHTNVNALLAFEQRLTREQLTAFLETFVRHVRDGRQREAQEDMARRLMEYPGDTALRLNCAALISVLEMSFPDESEETKAAWHEKQRALYEEAALSENVAERESASCALASMDLAEGRLDAAQARLDALPESREDTTLLRVQLLKKRGEDDRALEVVQKQLYRAVAQTLERLTLLMEARTDAHDALQIADLPAGGGDLFRGRRHERRADDGAVFEAWRNGRGALLPETAGGCRGRPGDDAEPDSVCADDFAPNAGKPNAAGVAHHAFARPAGGKGACRPSGNADLSRRGFAVGRELKISLNRRKRLGNGLSVRLFCAIV